MNAEASASADEQDSAPAARSWRKWWGGNQTLYLALLAITVLAGFLRFWRIGQQSFWVDESHTIERTCSTFSHIFYSLRDQAFPPGWYVGMWVWIRGLFWWRGSELAAYDPGALRCLPATLGTLMPLAMYFLARAFTDRKGALLVALLTAVNPYLIYYSRDLKMYMALWFFVALHLGLFLQWQGRPQHWLWWPLWAISGAVMVSLHSLGWLAVGVELIWLLTRPRIRSLDAPLWMLGVGMMGIIPGWWYLYRSVWLQKYEYRGAPPGLDWVAQYTKMDWNALASLPSAHLLGFLVPHDPPDEQTMGWFGLGDDFSNHLATRTLPWLATWETRCILILAGLAVLGLIPWRGIRRSAERENSITAGRWWWVAVWIALPVIAVGVGSLPQPGLHLQLPTLDESWATSAKWIAALGVLLWLAIVVWLAPYRSAAKNIGWIGALAVILSIGWAMVHGITLSWPPHHIVWEPRYLGVICPAMILALAALLRRLPTWPVRTLAFGFVICASLASAMSNYLVYRQDPWDRVASIAMEYYDKSKPRSLAVGHPAPRWSAGCVTYSMLHAMGTLPTPENVNANIPEWHYSRQLRADSDYLKFLQQLQLDKRIQTIVLTDKEGDVPDGPLGNTALAAALPGWKLIHEEHYRVYYEWHYYFFSEWRTRVWMKSS